jgi:transposase
MRGHRERSGSLFSYVSIEERIPARHPLRRIWKLADQVLDRLNPTFCAQYATESRPSVPPEQLLLASLLQAFYGIRSERLLMEQLAPPARAASTGIKSHQRSLGPQSIGTMQR